MYNLTELDEIETKYHQIHAAVKAVCAAKEKRETRSNIMVNSWYIFRNHIGAEVEYYGNYSGNKIVKITLEELNAQFLTPA